VEWIAGLGEPSLAAQLARNLSALYCTFRDGSEATVDPDNYPGIRYLRHEADFPGKSTDAQLQQVAATVNDIKVALRARGIRV
jgi:hypothetical protein